jgi:hypothetical protein
MSALNWQRNKKLNLIDAEKWVKYQRIIAAPPMALSIFLLCLSALKTVYWKILQADLTALLAIGPVKHTLDFIYAKMQFLSIFWEIAPLLATEEINSVGNYYALFLLCVIFISFQILESADHLNKRIKNAYQKAEERGWINQMEGRENRSITQHDITSIEFTINKKDQWYTRPIGIVALTVASGVLLQIANLSLGLT